LEKAWAKVNGSYENTIAGTASEAFRVLTGAPCDYFDHGFDEDIWGAIKSADKKKFIICASAGKPDMSDEDTELLGLVSNHAYSVIWADDVETPEGVVKLLKLRNPWGHKEWQGEWSDKSSKWTTELKEKLNFIAEEDGIFHISFENFLEYYTSTTICKYIDGFTFSNIKF
jgi:calpain-15